jgi:ATP-dependent exoDNAse (exonuclease V) beta subunit
MAARTPTPEQKSVIEAPHGSFTVVASAGAGKTFVLVERYLRHVTEDGLRPDQILTITFTKKAAAEMKQRIVSGLRAKERYADAQIAETGPIQTIHSFCERVLRENALEAGLDPQFEILSDQQTTRLVTQSIREALASDLVDEPDAADLIRYLAGNFGGGGFQQATPYSRLEGDITKLLHELRSGAVSLELLQDIYGSHTLLRAKWEDGVRRALPDSVRAAFDDQDTPDLAERVQRACKAAGVGIPAWGRGRGNPDAEADSVVHTCGLVQLACASWWRLDREMARLQSLDFSALEIRADRLLARSEITRQRLASQYRVVMVDESQDVNPIQYRLLDNLGGQHTMMVGDSQQSIYGFRQADVRLFQWRAASKETRRLSKN